MTDRINRLVCRARGCDLHDEYPACHRCGSALYGGDFIEAGWLDPLISAYYRLKRRLEIKHCDVCGKRMPWRRTVPCCSDKCFDQWIPF